MDDDATRPDDPDGWMETAEAPRARAAALGGEVKGSVLPAEVEKFDALADRWWDPRGPMRALHAMNPVRVGWIDAELRGMGLAGTTLLDVGCGAGLAAEALAALGYDVLGIDAAPETIRVAQGHAPAGLRLAYRQASAETLVAEGATFAAVSALEVIEHVADPAAFVGLLARLVRPGGAVFVSTLNRTVASYATAKLGAEYVLRMLPAGTHAWRQFVTPAELAGHCRAAGLHVQRLSGLRMGLSGQWRAVRDPSVNYIACSRKIDHLALTPQNPPL